MSCCRTFVFLSSFCFLLFPSLSRHPLRMCSGQALTGRRRCSAKSSSRVDRQGGGKIWSATWERRSKCVRGSGGTSKKRFLKVKKKNNDQANFPND